MIEPDEGGRSAWRSPESWLLFVSAMSAGFGVPAWVTIPAATAGLLALSLPKYVLLYPRAKAVGATGAFLTTVGASVLNATLAAVAAHLLGRVAWWL